MIKSCLREPGICEVAFHPIFSAADLLLSRVSMVHDLYAPVEMKGWILKPVYKSRVVILLQWKPRGLILGSFTSVLETG